MPLDGVNVVDPARAGRIGDNYSRSPMPEMPGSVLQLTLEAPMDVCRQALPPALHPLNPGVLVLTAYEMYDAASGRSFRLVEVGIQCRAGARARRYIVGAAIDDAEMGGRLAENWGYLTKPARICLERRYERIDLTVSAEATVLRASLCGPEPVVPSAVMYVAGLRPMVHGERPWIGQFERSFEISRADRGRPEVAALDARWWGDGTLDGLRATAPISGSCTQSAVTLNPLRFLIGPSQPRSADTHRLADILG